MKKISDDIANALDKCAEALSINELSRVTGVRIELLRRFITRKTRHVRGETWDRIYPVLRPYLRSAEPEKEKPPIRIGRPYLRNHDLVEMLSDEKILLDAFDALPDAEKSRLTDHCPGEPTGYASLSAQENRLLGIYLKQDEAERKKMLAEVLEIATAEVRRRRKQLF